MVNCAGIPAARCSRKYAVETWDRVLDINLRERFCAVRRRRSDVAQSKGDHPTFIYRWIGGVGVGANAYCASKGA